VIKKLLSIILIAVVLFAPTAVPSSASSEYLYDPFDILAPKEEQTLADHLYALNSQSHINYYLVVSERRSDALKYDTGNTVVLLVEYDEDYDEYFYELFTYGDADTAIKNREVNRILDDPEVCKDLKSGNILDGAYRALTLIDTAAHDDLRGDNWLLKTILISFAISVVIASLVCGIIIYKYKKKLKSPIYPLDRYATLGLIPENSRDIFLHKTLTRVRINTSSTSGGSRSSGSRGGGSRGRR
jgi:uncharacterized membrane protein YgcG